MNLIKSRALAAGLVLAVGMLPFVAATAEAQGQGRPPTGLTVPIDGTVAGTAGGGVGTLTGTFTITRFAQANDGIVAVGTLVATITDTATGTTRTVVSQIALPLAQSATTATCEILHLELGPLDLNLLGLQVHLDRVVLDITAVPGPGNLLGNLLCAIAGLLDDTGSLSALVGLLNNLLAVLG